MKVKIKKFDVEMQVKAKGVEMEVRSVADDTQLGDCYVTMTGLIWCKGKKDRKNGITVKWQDFIDICASKDSLKAAISAAKSV